MKSSDTGRWIEWAGENLPADQRDARISAWVENWTQKDFPAAGAWLTTAPDGPVKNTAIRSYAETVASYQPETAAQWAVTLPPGKDRDQTLKRIYQNWPRTDPASKAAASAFAVEHGIK